MGDPAIKRPIALPPGDKRGMIEPPHFDSYSVPARICLGIAIFSAALLVATVLMNAFDMRKVALSLRPVPIDITPKAPALD
jgi:hypothetical protein